MLKEMNVSPIRITARLGLMALGLPSPRVSRVLELSDDGTSFEESYKSAGSKDNGVWSGVRQ
jgi:hypothetical protein